MVWLIDPCTYDYTTPLYSPTDYDLENGERWSYTYVWIVTVDGQTSEDF